MLLYFILLCCSTLILCYVLLLLLEKSVTYVWRVHFILSCVVLLDYYIYTYSIYRYTAYFKYYITSNNIFTFCCTYTNT